MREKLEQRARQSSEAIFHTKQHISKNMEALEEKRMDIEKGNKMENIFQMENAFGSISLGVNAKQEVAFVVNQKKHTDGTLAKRNEKILNRQRSNAWNNRIGYAELNNDAKQEGAYGLILNKGWTPEKNILRETADFQKEMKQQLISTMIPSAKEVRQDSKEYAKVQTMMKEIHLAMEKARHLKKEKDAQDQRAKVENEIDGMIRRRHRGKKEEQLDENSKS